MVVSFRFGRTGPAGSGQGAHAAVAKLRSSLDVDPLRPATLALDSVRRGLSWRAVDPTCMETQRKTCEARYQPWPWGSGSSFALSARSPGTRPLGSRSSQRPPQEIAINVICITLASARLVYGPNVAERSTMVVGPLPRPSGRFLPRLGPAAPACGAFFFRVCGEKPGEEAAACRPRKKARRPRAGAPIW